MNHNNIKVYTLFVLSAMFIILPIFIFQHFFVYNDFESKYLLAPLLVSIIFGSLIGYIYILKRDILRNEQLFHAIANEAKEFSYFQDLQGNYLYLSPAAIKLTGYDQDVFENNPNFFATLVVDEDKPLWEKHQKLVRSSNAHDELEFRIQHKNGDILWINHNCSMVYEKGQPIGYRSVNTDITQRKIAESEMTHLALHDSLTKLPNRKSIFEKLDQLTSDKEPFSILFLDLNRFKRINDTFGHKIGDDILMQVALNLQQALQPLFVGRLGGDEFVVILERLTATADIQPIIDKLLEDIETDYMIEDLTLYIGLSIGIASFPHDARTKKELLACADKAMYKAKQQNNLEYVYYKEILEYHKNDEFFLEKKLRSAIKNQELAVHFQPKINTQTHSIHSFEALIRWETKGQSFSPDIFIPLAEKTGLIKHITQFVISEVFNIAKIWQQQNGCHKFSINVSVIDFMSDHLLEFIQAAIKKYQVDPQWFEIEITENLFLEKTEAIKNRLQELINMGFNIALDDFGTGYSSLAYLTSFPIKTLKIDKTFIENLEHDYDKNYPLLKSIVTLAQELKLNIIAEGVETQKELDILNALGCHIIQGHYFSKALPVEQLPNAHSHLAS